MDQDEAAQRASERVEAFVLRARRIQSHSLVADREALVAWTSPRLFFEPGDEPGTVVLIQRTPPEEQVESLAARVRPLILANDTVFHRKVFKSLSWLTRETKRQDIRRDLAALKRQWAEVDPRNSRSSWYHVEASTLDAPDDRSVASDNELAFAWFYGDVVHADPLAQAAAAGFDIRERYRAAVHVVARIAVLAGATLELVYSLYGQGFIQLPAEVLRQAVVVTETETRRVGRGFSADVGTYVPDGPFGEGWTPLVLPRPQTE